MSPWTTEKNVDAHLMDQGNPWVPINPPPSPRPGRAWDSHANGLCFILLLMEKMQRICVIAKTLICNVKLNKHSGGKLTLFRFEAIINLLAKLTHYINPWSAKPDICRFRGVGSLYCFPRSPKNDFNNTDQEGIYFHHKYATFLVFVHTRCPVPKIGPEMTRIPLPRFQDCPSTTLSAF